MAGTITTNAVVLGDSATAANNFQLRSNTDGSMKLARGATGALGDILTVDASGNLANAGSPIQRMVLSTAQNTTSGTTALFTGIPTWAKRITMSFNGVNYASGNLQVQAGNASVETTGYASSMSVNSGTSVVTSNVTTGFLITSNSGSANSGSFVMTLVSGNIWAAQSMTNAGGANSVVMAAGQKSFSGVVDRIQLTAAGAFSAGSVNLLLEG